MKRYQHTNRQTWTEAERNTEWCKDTDDNWYGSGNFSHILITLHDLLDTCLYIITAQQPTSILHIKNANNII